MMNFADRVPITSPHNVCRGHFGSSQSRLDRIAITSHFSLARRVSFLAELFGSGRLGNGIGISINFAPGEYRPGDARHLVGQGDLSRLPANGRWNGLFAWDEGCGGKHGG